MRKHFTRMFLKSTSRSNCKTLTLAILIVTQFTPVFLQDDEEASQDMQPLKKQLEEDEYDMLLSIAQGETDQRNHDDYDDGGALDGNSKEGDEEDKDEEEGDPASEYDTNLIVQKMRKDKNATTYHEFVVDEEEESDIPLFTRTSEDYDVDFIIFINPAFPAGTGHYVVLRRLEIQSDNDTDVIDEGVSSEHFNDMEQLLEGDDPELYSALGDSEEGEDGEKEDGQQSDEEKIGYYQSGEENYEDLNGNYDFEDESEEGGTPSPNKTRGADSVFIKSAADVPVEKQDDAIDPEKDTNKTVIYEAFTIDFKESIHGYISDVDPLQYIFDNAEQIDDDYVERLPSDDSEDYDGDDSEDDESEDEETESEWDEPSRTPSPQPQMQNETVDTLPRSQSEPEIRIEKLDKGSYLQEPMFRGTGPNVGVGMNLNMNRGEEADSSKGGMGNNMGMQSTSSRQKREAPMQTDKWSRCLNPIATRTMLNFQRM